MNGFTSLIVWGDKGVVNYGLGLLLEGEEQEGIISCTFYKPQE